MAEHRVTCPLCEATCGLRISTEDGESQRVNGIRGNRDDMWSRGHLCPKGG
jgi:anaerobic selenocysteine-containing dehydrogenase